MEKKKLIITLNNHYSGREVLRVEDNIDNLIEKVQMFKSNQPQQSKDGSNASKALVITYTKKYESANQVYLREIEKSFFDYEVGDKVIESFAEIFGLEKPLGWKYW